MGVRIAKNMASAQGEIGIGIQTITPTLRALTFHALRRVILRAAAAAEAAGVQIGDVLGASMEKRWTICQSGVSLFFGETGIRSLDLLRGRRALHST